jgi:hypothetical protein
MKEYINLYYLTTGEKKIEADDDNCIKKIVDFDDIDIPEDYESPTFYSSNAKQAKQEIHDYHLTSTENEKMIQVLKDKIYAGDVIGVEFLKNFAKENNFDCKKYFLF